MLPETYDAYFAESARLIAETPAHIPAARLLESADLCVKALKAGQSILVCGNGGSASDAMHITGELVGRFVKERKGLRCICLSDNPATLTAWANDYAYETVFSRQVEAYGTPGSVLIALSTSGNSPNVLKAAEKAKELGLKVIGLTGQGGGKMAAFCDILLDAPTQTTALVQQVHLCLYHYLCAEIEKGMMTL